MDALAGYGSGSSSEESEGEEGAGQKQNNPLSGLLGAVSDDDDDDDDSSVDNDPQQKHPPKAQVPPPTKRQRIEEPQQHKQQQQQQTSFSSSFPAPDMATNSVTLWNIDYLSEQQTKKKSTNNNNININNNKELSEKLNKLATSLGIHSWADHLKAQHEFHNPHFFESVVEHFGISHPLGSQVVSVDPIASRPLQSYEVELFPVAAGSSSNNNNNNNSGGG